MISAWKVPDQDGLKAVMSALVTTAADASLGDSDVQRSDKCIVLVVQRIRGMINSVGRCPLSKTENSVPPEGEQHALVLAVQMLTGSNKNLAKYAISEPGGSKTPFMLQIEAAEKWIDQLKDGLSVTRPTDPEDNFQEPIAWGDYQGSDADYEAGTVTPQDMSTN